MATVKNLEDRIDDLAEDLSAVKVQLAVVSTKLDIFSGGQASLQAQFQAVATQLVAVLAGLASAVSRLDAVSPKLDNLAIDHGAFKAKSENTFAFVRWVGVTAAGVLVMATGGAFAVLHAANDLQGTVHRHQSSLDQQQKTLEQLQKTSDQQQKTLELLVKTSDQQQKTLELLVKTSDQQQKTLDEIKRELAELRKSK